MTARADLAAQGLTSGFGFLEQSTGWQIGFSLIDYGTSSPYWRAILAGILNSLFLGAISLTLATLVGVSVGVSVGVMRTSGNAMAELVGTTFVEIFRNIPLILQLFFWHALLLGLPSPRDVSPILGGIALTGRGIYLPGLNVSGGSVLIALSALVAAFALALWLGTARRWQALAPKRLRRLIRLTWATGAILAVLALWLGRLPETPLLSIPEQRGLNFRGGIRVPPPS